MRSERWNGIASSRRSLSITESLTHFASMATGSPEGLKWCIRAKISFTDPNKAMRDPVIYRCNLLPHHRTGDKFKIYPTYDFACPIVDCLEGVTHALRTNEYRDRNPQYHWMLEKTGLRKVEIWDFGRMNFVYTLLSKRKLKWFVEEGKVRGWDDPRFATVRGSFSSFSSLPSSCLHSLPLPSPPLYIYTNYFEGKKNRNQKKRNDDRSPHSIHAPPRTFPSFHQLGVGRHLEHQQESHRSGRAEVCRVGGGGVVRFLSLSFLPPYLLPPTLPPSFP